MNLIDGIRYLFGSRTAVAYRPPNAAPRRADDSLRGAHRPASLRSGTGDRLPPRERRGRD